MQLDHLRYFIELARAGSFARAAGALLISAQGLNKAIASIESELGVGLVVRGNQGTELTADGKLFLAYAQDAVARYEAMTDELALSKREALGDAALTIGATSYALHTVFGGPFDPAEFGTVRVQEMGPTEIARAMEEGDARLFVTDLIDGTSLAARCREHGRFKPIFRTGFGVICHENFPLAKDSLSADELCHIPLACFHDESIDWVMGKIMGGHAAENVLLRTSNSEQLIKYVMSRRAVSLLDSFAYSMIEVLHLPYADSIRYIPVVGLPQATTGFLYNPTSADVQRLQLFIDAYTIAFQRRFGAYLRRHPLG